MFGFHDCGRKIKIWAMVAFAIGVALAIICGVSDIIDGINNEEWNDIRDGILKIILGPIVAWLLALLLYGFGELIESSDLLVEQGIQIVDILEKEKSENENEGDSGSSSEHEKEE